MSLVLTIPQLREMSEGGIPEAFKGKIKKVWKRRSGTNEHGEWTLQTVVITDGTTDIDLCFNSRDEVPPSVVGKTIYVEATKGDRGLQGTKRKDYAPAGKPVVPQINVTAAANVTYEGVAPAQQSQSAPQRQVTHHTDENQTGNGDGNPPASRGQQSQSPQQATAQTTRLPLDPEPQTKSKDDLRTVEIKAFNRRLAQTSSAFLRCIDASYACVAEIRAKHDKGFAASPELIEKIAMGLMVNACWDSKPANIENFPIKPFSAYDTKSIAIANGTDNGRSQQQAPFA